MQHIATSPNYFVVIVAAGTGSRFGHKLPKQYHQLAGQPVLVHSVDKVCSAVAKCTNLTSSWLVINPNDKQLITQTCQFNTPLTLVNGGAERLHSVFNALKYIKKVAKADDFVVIHDAARPLVREVDVAKLLAATTNHAVGGILAVPVRDTLKKVGSDDGIRETISREALWQAQTPQVLRFGVLYDALVHIIDQNLMVTDDAHAVEIMGYQPLVVQGHPDNIKITYHEDMVFAKQFIR